MQELFAHNFYPTGNNVQSFIEQFHKITAMRQFYNSSISPTETIAEDNELIFFEEINAYSTVDNAQMSGQFHNIFAGTYIFRAQPMTDFGAVIQYQTIVRMTNVLVYRITNISNVGFATSYGYIFTYE